jgi:hypothetical protein
VAQLQAEIKKCNERIDDRDGQLVQMGDALTHLKRWINLEHLFLEDRQERAFISYLKTSPKTPFVERVLAWWKAHDMHPVRGDRFHFETTLRLWLRVTDEELLQFRDLWKLMMLDRSRDDF